MSCHFFTLAMLYMIGVLPFYFVHTFSLALY